MATNLILYKGSERRLVVKGSLYDQRIRKLGWVEKPTRASTSAPTNSSSQPTSEQNVVNNHSDNKE